MKDKSKKLKYLLIGSYGQLGKEFVKRLDNNGSNYLAVDIDKLDISDYSAVSSIFDSFRPDVTINCSAYNNVDLAESKPEDANNVNALGPKYLAVCCKKYNCFLIHYSSDYVFDGTKKDGLYTETDNVNPINEYGKSKLLGEKLISEETDDFLIFRLSWVYGDGSQNFIQKMKGWSEKNSILNISFDEISVPTSTKTIVEITEKALESGLTGTYHLTNSGYASRYEWAKAIAKYLKMNLILHPVSKDLFNLPAKRPSFSAMSNRKISDILDTSISPWEDALKDFLE
jgi:dTDP-4-dehydrorhamnose reductase